MVATTIKLDPYSLDLDYTHHLRSCTFTTLAMKCPTEWLHLGHLVILAFDLTLCKSYNKCWIQLIRMSLYLEELATCYMTIVVFLDLQIRVILAREDRQYIRTTAKEIA